MIKERFPGTSGATWLGVILAAYVSAAVVAAKEDVDGRADLWSLQPPAVVAPPRMDDAWVRTPVDAFVLEAMREQGLEPSEAADRATLIRRLCLILHGLAPGPEDVQAFVDDPDPLAYESLVDRALASPRYGERWARHWLDVVRFGDTHGFETNRDRETAWHYRDYVIESFNTDKPYDQFTREQIAGDVLDGDLNGDLDDGYRGTGFLVAGPHDLVGSPDITLTLTQRQDELADIVNTTGTTFLALTLGCARCHDHKFDPITQKDYYSIQAIFAGVEHGDRALPIPAARATAIEETTRETAKLRQHLEEFRVRAPERFIVVDDMFRGRGPNRGMHKLRSRSSREKYTQGTGRGESDEPAALPTIADLERRYSVWLNQPGQPLGSYQLRAPGRHRVWLSWGCWSPQPELQATYSLDRDGDLRSRDDQTVLATVDQRHFADGTLAPTGNALWSGLLDAGVHDLTEKSVITVSGGKSTDTYVTTDVVLLVAVPEDSVVESRDGKPLPTFRPPVHPRRNVERFDARQARYVRLTILATNGAAPSLDELEVFAGGENVALADRGTLARSSADATEHPATNVNDGRYGDESRWISGNEARGWIELELPETLTIDRIEWSRDRAGEAKDGLVTRYVVEVAREPGQWERVVSEIDRLPYNPEVPAQPVYRFDDRSPTEAARGERLLAELETSSTRLASLENLPKAYLGRFREPGPIHRLYRGDPMAPREEVSPDTLAVLHRLDLSAETPERQRRLEFARWLTAEDNPLPARVLVNRLWQYIFGVAIVDTPSDFGSGGTRPTHPELLDWLALEFVREDWSVKRMLRQILISSAFRQSSRPRPDAAEVDTDARFLWRFPPRRLEAEGIRDGILRTSGVLDLTMGGPGFSAFVVEPENVVHYHPKTSFGSEDWRRMIYMIKVRQEQDAVFGAFDCPDASQVMPKRSRSTTPLQALNLFNSNFTLQQAELFAKRLKSEAPDGIRARVRLGFRLAFGREPQTREVDDAAAFVAAEGLPAFCRALFNANEFLFIP